MRYDYLNKVQNLSLAIQILFIPMLNVKQKWTTSCYNSIIIEKNVVPLNDDI